MSVAYHPPEVLRFEMEKLTDPFPATGRYHERRDVIAFKKSIYATREAQAGGDLAATERLRFPHSEKKHPDRHHLTVRVPRFPQDLFEPLDERTPD